MLLAVSVDDPSFARFHMSVENFGSRVILTNSESDWKMIRLTGENPIVLSRER